MASFVRKPLLVRKDLTVFQYALLLTKPFPVTLWKYAFLTDLVDLLQNFFASFKAKKFSLDGHFCYLFLILDLFIISLLSSFVMKESNLNTLVKVEYISLLLLYISP